MGKTHVIIHSLDLSEAQIDEQRQTVTQRLIQAGRSGNGRHYSPEVLQSAISAFEGTRSFSDHPSRSEQRDKPERSIRQITGWIDNVVYREDALWGTRHFTRNQAGQDAWALIEDIINKKAPASLVGASINALGKGRKDETSGDVIVESIDRVLSVDDVTSPAAGGGFVAQESDSLDLTAALLETVDFDEWRDAHPDYEERLKKEWQTIRQSKAVKTAQAEAEDLQAVLHQTGDQLEALQTTNATLTEEVQRLSRELLLERALQRVKLPAVWLASLRKTLMATPYEAWESVIGQEIAKAAHAEPKQSSPVSIAGAGQRIQEAFELTSLSARDRWLDAHPDVPRDDETIDDWQRRIAQGKRES